MKKFQIDGINTAKLLSIVPSQKLFRTFGQTRTEVAASLDLHHVAMTCGELVQLEIFMQAFFNL